MTQECQSLYKQFIDFKEKTWAVLDMRKELGDRMVYAEKLTAQTYPIYDQRLLSDPKSPLKLYDCLAPQLHEYIHKPIQLLPNTHI